MIIILVQLNIIVLLIVQLPATRNFELAGRQHLAGNPEGKQIQPANPVDKYIRLENMVGISGRQIWSANRFNKSSWQNYALQHLAGKSCQQIQ